ncbi:MAG: phosphoribosylanthranilate isomerase [Bacteroidetes bacterium]|nr:phosphoribosylanthranilate isomerase [Bacteroidota bacterium]MBU1115608.1 phosphoribosylanthranilate isomerase [Bacteroidota bacterium]MBU1797077.1 phosphoribosylanthranilate isomerase [Bacteroidota bacterium]
MLFNKFIQIAGISGKSEADMLINSGINYLGFPLRLPVNKEDISENEAAEIIKYLNPPNYGIVITYLNIAEEIVSFCSELNASMVQLHGNIEIAELKKLKSIAPNLVIIKSLIVGKYTLEELKSSIDEQSEFVDAFITDTFNPESGATGATGLTHDWQISKILVEYSSKPIILAGGLNPENVFDAIIKVKPAGVDSHTGVENESGAKDELKVQKFYVEAIRAFEQIK